MFGYVRSREDSLSPEARQRYEAVYCGMCHVLQREYGTVSRLFLNYDFVFLAMLLAPEEGAGEAACLKCPLHPIGGKPACGGGEWMEIAAGESVILAWWKLGDTMKDGGFLSRLGARLLRLLLAPAYRRARARHPVFDDRTARLLEELERLERERSPAIDPAADCFARLLSASAPETGQPRVDRPRQELLYHLGRWIYLVDAVDDLSEDGTAGRYNPVAARFPGWSGEDREYLRQSLERSLDRMGAAFQLLPSNPWRDVLENIIYSGLPAVEALVFDGKWREYQNRRRRKSG